MTEPRLDKLMSIQDAELFLQEARTPYERVCAKNALTALREVERLREENSGLKREYELVCGVIRAAVDLRPDFKALDQSKQSGETNG